MECDKQQYPYRIVVNKHYRNASSVSESNFVQGDDNIPYVLDDIYETKDYTPEGEIVVCNEKEKEGIYILSLDPTDVDADGKPNPGAYSVVRITGAESVRIPGIAHFEAGNFEILSNDTVQTAVGKLDSHIKEVDERINDKVDVLHAVLDEKINEVDGRTNKRVEDIEDHVDVVHAVINTKIDDTDDRINAKIDRVEDQLDARIDALEGIQIEKLSDAEIANHNDILAAYRLINANDEPLGDIIEIPNSLYDVYLVDENGNRVDDQYANDDNVTGLTLVYNAINGTQHSVTIPLGSFLQEAEFKNGLEVVNGQVNVKINKDQNDERQDGFLEVDDRGVRIQGLRQYIEDIKRALSAYTDSNYSAATAYTNAVDTSARTDLSAYMYDRYTAATDYADQLYASVTSHTNNEVSSARTDLSAYTYDKYTAATDHANQLYASATSYTHDVETNFTNFEEGIEEIVTEKTEDVFEYRFGGGQKDKDNNPVYAIRIGYDSNSKTIRLIYRDKNGVEKPMQLGVSVDEFLAYVSGLQSARVIEVTDEDESYDGVHYAVGTHLLELIYTTTATGQEDREVKIYTKLTGYDALEVLSETEYQYRLENDDIDPDIFYYTYED